jgi:rubrerythrin
MQAIAIEHELLIENLRTAFEHESSAHLRYLEFAEKAEREGWHGIASLFRATASAERIHAANHARILHQLGVIAEHPPQPVEVKTTFENLSTALAGEMFEADTMYPGFIELARTLRDVAAVRTFTWALHAEKPMRGSSTKLSRCWRSTMRSRG